MSDMTYSNIWLRSIDTEKEEDRKINAAERSSCYIEDFYVFNVLIKEQMKVSLKNCLLNQNCCQQ